MSYSSKNYGLTGLFVNSNTSHSAGNISLDLPDWTTSNLLSANSSTEEQAEYLDWQCTITKTFKIVNLTISIIVVLGTYFGNGLLLISLRKFRNHFKGSLYMFLSNLAVADIFLAVGLTLHIFENVLPHLQLQYDFRFCGIKMAFTIVSLNNSGMTLIFMSIDRFCAITYPMHHFLRHRQKRRIWTVIIAIWIISVLAGFIPTAATVKNMKYNKLACRYGLCVPRILTLLTVAFILFQMLFNFALAALVVWKVKMSGKSATRIKRKSMRSKSALLIKVYVLFALCWLPFIALTILLESDLPQELRRKTLCFREYALFVGMTNSMMNWILFGLVNSKFRKAFRHILCCRDAFEYGSSVPT